MSGTKPKKLKYVPEEFVAKCEHMSQDELIKELKTRLANLADYKKKKSSSEYLKELRKEIADFRKTWKKEHPKVVEEFEALKDSYIAEKDKKIINDIAELKDLEAGFNDAINGAKEYVEVVIESIRIA